MYHMCMNKKLTIFTFFYQIFTNRKYWFEKSIGWSYMYMYVYVYGVFISPWRLWLKINLCPMKWQIGERSVKEYVKFRYYNWQWTGAYNNVSLIFHIFLSTKGVFQCLIVTQRNKLILELLYFSNDIIFQCFSIC